MNANSNQLYIEDFQNVLSRARGTQVKVVCPLCHDRRTNKADRALSINTQTLEYHCHYCDAKGVLKSKEGSVLGDSNMYRIERRQYIKPKPKKENASKFAESFLEYFKGRGISEATLIKAKVTQETEYFPQKQAKAGCIGFNYYLNGELINVKYRTRDKDFKLISGARLIPYNIDSININSFCEKDEKYVIICEGEADCLTWIECGKEHAISVPNGASNNTSYLDDFIEEYFDKLDVIYLSVDNDTNGIILQKELLRRFGESKCRIITYPKPCKDINEVLTTYGKQEVLKCFETYTEIKPDGVKDLHDYEADLDYLFYHGFEAGIKVGDRHLDEIISFKVGLVTVVTGVPSSGKSFALNYIMAKLNVLHDWKVAYYSPEFYPVHEHLGQIIETYGGKRFSSQNYTKQEYEIMKDYIYKNIFVIDPDDTDISSIMDRAVYLVRKRGIKALVIDPFNSITDKDRKIARQDEYVSDFMQKLRWFARKYAIAVFIVMHPIKQVKLESGLYPVCDLYACKGGAEIRDKADIGLTVWRNEFEDYAEIHTTKVKFRHLGKIGKHATFKFNINNGRYSEIEDIETLKKQGIGLNTIQVNWDNSNWIIDKIKGNQVQQSLTYEQPQSAYEQFQQQFDNTPSGMPFAPNNGDEAPF